MLPDHWHAFAVMLHRHFAWHHAGSVLCIGMWARSWGSIYLKHSRPVSNTLCICDPLVTSSALHTVQPPLHEARFPRSDTARFDFPNKATMINSRDFSSIEATILVSLSFGLALFASNHSGRLKAEGFSTKSLCLAETRSCLRRRFQP